jgi:hypothetical protein
MATQGFVQVPPDSTGKKIDTVVTTTAAQHRHVMAIGAPDTDAALAPVTAANGLLVDVSRVAGNVASTVADGANVNQGANADAAVTGDNSGTLSAKLRGLSKMFADMWDSGNHWMKVSVQNASLAVTFAGSGVLTLQASQTSGTTNATTTRTTTTGLDAYTDLDLLVLITNAGAATGTLQLFLEDSRDGGTTWDDLVSTAAFTFGAGATNYQFAVSGKIATSRPQGQAAQQETLAAGSCRQGPFGERVRVREKVSGVSGSPTGVTYTITAVAKR